MALLQIEDPTARPIPIGIDLGTTHSLVARVASTGDPVVLLDCDNEALVPSVVHYAENGRVVVGRDAQALARNFVLWRTYVRRGETRGIIVLPGPGIRLSHRESLAVAVDLLCASGATAAPDGFVARLGGAASLGVVLHAAERKIQAALARGGLSD